MMKSIHENLSLKAGRLSLLLAGVVCGLMMLQGEASSMIGLGGSDENSMIGLWELSITTEGTTEGSSRKEAPVVIAIQLTGNRLTGKVTVPTVDPSATGIKTTGNRELTLDDLKLNGRKLTFRVDEDGAVLEAELTRVGNEEFEGRWRSRIQGRWKGAKNEFEGMLKLKRKK